MILLKLLKKLILTILTLLVVVLILVGGVATYVWQNPQESWQLIQERFLPKDLKITWGKLDIDIRYIDGLKFSFQGDISKFLLLKSSPEINIPIFLIHWNIGLDLLAASNQLTVREFTVQAKESMYFTAGPPDKTPAEESPFEQLQKYLNLLRKSGKFKIQKFDIAVEEFIFTSFEGKSTHIAANVVRSQKTLEDVVDFNAQVLLPGHPPVNLSIIGTLNFDRLASDQPFLDANFQLQGWGIDTQQKILFQMQNADTLVHSVGTVTYSKDKVNVVVAPDLWIRFNAKEAQVMLRANATGIPGPIAKVNGFEARLNMPFSEGNLWSREASSFAMTMPVQLFFIDTKMKPPLEKACECKIPETLKADFNGKVWLRDLLSDPLAEKRVVESRLSIESVKNKLLTIDFGALLNIAKNGKEYILQPQVDSHIVLHSFRGLRNYLDAKNILIPSPLDVLEGTVDIVAKGPLDLAKENYEFPILAQMRLSSKDQTVNVDASSTVSLSKKMDSADLNIKVQIQDLQLELPPLNPVGGIPKVAPDARILKQPVIVKATKERKFKMSLEFEIATAKLGAIRLLSQYAQPYIPISLSIATSEKKDVQGFVQTEPFKVEYLRRVVQVEKLRMDLENIEKNVLPLSGRLRIDQGDYKIFIGFEGTVQEPQITMSSEPYLNQNEIISVLLYGRTSDQLVSADAQTAGSFQAAMADRAIGLFGLWAFAATPIQSFSYNPISKVYTATVMITNDLTAGIGTNWEESARLELRKRVSRRWMLTASWTPNSDGDLEEKLVLQWEKRF